MPHLTEAALTVLAHLALGVAAAWAVTVPLQVWAILRAVRNADPATRRVILDALMRLRISWSFPHLVRLTRAVKRWG